MFFKRKKAKAKSTLDCPFCESEIEEKFDYCPYCGEALFDEEEQAREFGMIGKFDSDELEESEEQGFSEKMINSLFNSVMKSMVNQLNQANGNPKTKGANTNLQNKTNVQTFPNGIRISLGPFNPNANPEANIPKRATNQTSAPAKELTEKQLERIKSLPKTVAKTSVKRLGDRVIYNLAMPGVDSNEDILVSKLETGYEIKAIGKTKVYVNSIPVELPIKNLFLDNNSLVAEFQAPK